MPLLTLLICATIGIFYWQLIYLPIQSEILKFKTETRQIQLIRAEISKLQTRHGNFDDFVEMNDERLALAQEYFPAEMDDEKFIAELYNLADAKNILIYSVQTGENSGGEIQTQSIKIRAEAEYISLLNFIREVVDGARLVNFENFSIESDGKTNILDCEMEFSIFAANIEKVNVAKR